MELILELLAEAAVLLLLAKLIPDVIVRSFGTALAVAVVVGLLNATIGWILRLPLNIVTLGLLSFVVRLVVTAVMILLADRLFKGFEVRGFATALLVAVLMAIAGTLISYLIY
ncbi:MAG TPA: phage holin family protein [Chitinophagaceae bacterium]|jgi:putative membrane protein|nr:phage holin family protein [Chitinophagaceae bacterium]